MSRAAATALGGLALTLAALTFDASPLFVPGVGFVALGLLAPAWIWIAARRVRIERSLPVDRVLEQEPLESTVSLKWGLLGAPGGELHDPLLREPLRLRRRKLERAGSNRATLRMTVRFPRRGRQRLTVPWVLVGDPFGLARASSRRCGDPQEVLVLPLTERPKWSGVADSRLDARGAFSSLAPLAAPEVDGLRPYRDGTPASRIYWQALARGGELLERRLASDSRGRPLVVLDARHQGPPENLDAAVRAAASLTLELARGEGCALLLPGRRRPIHVEADLAAWPAAHTQLAVVERSTRAPALAPGAQLEHVFYVAAALPGRLTSRLLAGGHGVAALVLPEAVAAPLQRRASFVVAGCRGYTVRSSGASSERHLARRVA